MRHMIFVLISALMILSPATVSAQRSADGRNYERWLYINNEMTDGDAICEVYITHVDNPDWGRDLLGQYCIDPGYRMRVDPGWQQGYCRMDIKIVTSFEAIITNVIDICTLTDYTVY